MKYLTQFLQAFMDGFLPMFGILVLAFGGWYIYTKKLSVDEFANLPVIQEITDAYQSGWEITISLKDRVAERVVTINESTRIGTIIEGGRSVDDISINIPWTWQHIEQKLLSEGWSKGKMDAAFSYLTYVDSYMDEAVRDMYHTGISASVTIAQGILESDAGRSNLATKTNNHFGIKARANSDGRQKIKAKKFAELTDQDFVFKSPAVGVSQHYDDNRYDRFEVYRSVQDSYRRHSSLLQNNCKVARKGCYAWIWKAFPVQKEKVDITEMAEVFENVSGYAPQDFFGETEVPYYAAQAAGLKMAGYATSKTYHKKLRYIIETYELWRLDIALIMATS